MSRYSRLTLKVTKDLRGCFLCSKAEDAGELTPAKDDNAAARKTDRKDWTVLKLIDYIFQLLTHNFIGSKERSKLLQR